MHLRTASSVALSAFALAAAGCGDSTDDKDSAADTQAAPAATQDAPAPTTEAPPAAPQPKTGGAAAKLKISTDTKTKPKVPKPKGEAPTALSVNDVVKGTGPAVKAGEQISVQYVGVGFPDGKQFDASWDNGEPFPFLLGGGMVIPGWDQGIIGMRKGGRRTLVIPPDLAYGPQGSPPAIGPNEPLVFVVDLVDVSNSGG